MPLPKSFEQMWRDLAARITKLEQRSPFSNSGMSITGPGQFEIDGSVTVTGDFTAAGKINNDALTDPVVPGSVWQSTTSFSVTTSWASVISYSVTVPAGCTRLEADARARVTAFYNNVGTGIDYLYAHLSVGGQSSGYYPLAVTDNGGSGTNHVFRNVLLTGLTPGASVSFVLQTAAGFNNWSGPTASNEAQIGASLRWLR